MKKIRKVFQQLRDRYYFNKKIQPYNRSQKHPFVKYPDKQMTVELPKNILLFSLPFHLPLYPLYTVAYLKGIVAKTGWELHYVDLNNTIYSKAEKVMNNNKLDSRWNLDLYDEIEHFAEPIIFQTINDVLQRRYELICVTLMLSQRKFGELLLKALRKHNVNIPILFGGADCFSLEYGTKYLEQKYRPDIVCLGEAEIALPLFLDEFSQTRCYETTVKGFAYLTSNERIVNTGAPELSNLRGVPVIADYSVFDYKLYKYRYFNSVETFSSKGCINQCAFCSECKNYYPYRRRPLEDVISEIKSCIQGIPIEAQNNVVLNFKDSIFNTNAKYVSGVVDGILALQKTYGIRWRALGGFRVNLPKSLISKMKASNCINIFFGLETASQKVIDLIGKNYNINNAQETIDCFSKTGIDVRLPVLNGFPGEMPKDVLVTSAFILYNRSRPNVHFAYSVACDLREHTGIAKFPLDFLLNDIDITPGQYFANSYGVSDGLNTANSRRLITTINEVLEKETNLEIDQRFVNLDFNELSASVFLAQTLYYIDYLVGRDEKGQDLGEVLRLQKLPPQGIAPEDNTHSELNQTIYNERFAIYNHFIPGQTLQKWFHLDKNQHNIKLQILRSLDYYYMRLEYSIKERQQIDYIEFRNSLFKVGEESLAHICAPPFLFEVVEFRLSQYDKGKHLIVRGFAYDEESGTLFSAIFARTGNIYTDIHYGIRDDTDTKGRRPDFKYRGFWGKFLLGEQLKKHGLEIIVVSRKSVAYKFDLRVPKKYL